MFTELQVEAPLPMTMFSDNEAAVLTVSTEHINKIGRTKYMNRQLFHLNDKVTDGLILPAWINTEEMDADIGTKALMGARYDYLSNRQFSRLYCIDPLNHESNDSD